LRSLNKRLKAKAVDLFSQYIRRKYADESGNCVCYTCGRVRPWKEMHAGHGIAGRGNYILFKEEVVRVQDSSCNLNQPRGKGGNYQVFVPKLIREYGLEQYEEWERESKRVHKRTTGDYEQLIAELTEQLKEFDEQGK